MSDARELNITQRPVSGVEIRIAANTLRRAIATGRRDVALAAERVLNDRTLFLRYVRSRST